MRYFRDLGADAHLLLYANDGKGTLSHFTPEADTWNIEKWAPFIHQTKIPNAVIAAYDFPMSWLMSLHTIGRNWLMGGQKELTHVSQAALHQTYGAYDCLVASGISPATLMRINRRLDIFYPYSDEVEFLYNGEFITRLNTASLISQKILRRVQQKQSKGIQQAIHLLNFNPGTTEDALRSIKVQPKRFSIPMVYNREVFPSSPPNKLLRTAAEQISGSCFSILHSARLLWKKQTGYSDEEWIKQNKNNDKMLKAFAKFLALRPETNPRLFLLEYGSDIIPTKNLIGELEIVSSVTWLPKMKRKELMWILAKVSVSLGEFYDLEKMTWGGTGWEALAVGRPLIQGFNFAEGEFEKLMGYPPPPLLPVRKQDDILHHLLYLIDNPDQIKAIGNASKQWFEAYNGISLSRQWLSLLEKSDNQKEQVAGILKN